MTMSRCSRGSATRCARHRRRGAVAPGAGPPPGIRAEPWLVPGIPDDYLAQLRLSDRVGDWERLAARTAERV